MASLVEPAAGELRVVDPGAGAGALMLALVAAAVERGGLKRLSVDLVETDPQALRLLETAVRAAHVVAEAHGLRLAARIVDHDFCDSAGWAGGGSFDAAILNPPYMKLGASDPCRGMVRRHHGVDCPNLYAAFLAVAVALLRDGGRLVAITPRSFANGLYFTDFRRQLTEAASFFRVILFDRRDRVFSSSSVLQETVIFSMLKTAPREGDFVRVETWSDHLSGPHEVHDVPHGDVVSSSDPHRFINLPGRPDVMRAAELVAALPADLQSLGLVVSTGPVVDFRCREFLTGAHAEGSVPLIYPSNVKQAGVKWPLDVRKAQGFKAAPQTLRWLFPNGHYVLVKRFTAKEERRRVVAGVYGPVDSKRHIELKEVFGTCTAGLVFVSCFPDQATMKKYLTDISWETEVWTSDHPTHLVHFDGERFLGPYSD